MRWCGSGSISQVGTSFASDPGSANPANLVISYNHAAQDKNCVVTIIAKLAGELSQNRPNSFAKIVVRDSVATVCFSRSTAAMVSKRTGRPCGRPPWDWRTWTHRYAVAIADAFQAIGVNERQAIDLAVVFLYAREIPPPINSRFTASYELQRRPGAPATIKGRASTIRLKANRKPVPVDFAEWRVVFGLAFLLAIKPGKDRNSCRSAILDLAIKADRLRNGGGDPLADQIFSIRVLLPLTILETSPEFSTSDK
jgi:hypothetical protein